MRPDPSDATNAAGWLRRARSNLAVARAVGSLPPEVLYEDLCFDAQQAAEKAIKALLIYRKVRFPKTHSIPGLLTLLEQSGLEVPEYIQQASALTAYAVETRYPGVSEEVSIDDYREAVRLAEDTVTWVEAIISG